MTTTLHALLVAGRFMWHQAKAANDRGFPLVIDEASGKSTEMSNNDEIRSADPGAIVTVCDATGANRRDCILTELQLESAPGVSAYALIEARPTPVVVTAPTEKDPTP